MRFADLDGMVFDLDGVLVESFELYLRAYGRTFEDVVGRRFADRDLLAMATPTETGTLRAALPAERLAEGLDVFHRWYVRLFDELARPCDEALQALVRAREQGRRVGVFTGKTRITARHSLERLGVGDAVACLSSEDDYTRPKPDEEGLVRVLRELALEPGRVLYVGDQAVDMAAGRSAGVFTAAALWARSTTIVPDRHGPDLAFAEAGELRDFVGEAG